MCAGEGLRNRKTQAATLLAGAHHTITWILIGG